MRYLGGKAVVRTRAAKLSTMRWPINSLIHTGVSLRTLAHYTTQLAKLGGYRARKGDTPSNTIMWRSLTRLTDIVVGMQFAAEVVGN